MSEFRFACPHCGQRLSGDVAYKGSQITCPSCQQTLTVPDLAAKSRVGEAAPIPSSMVKTSPLAIISLACSAAMGVGSVPGIILGHLAWARIRRDSSLRGKGLALAGMTMGYCVLLATIAFFTVGFVVLSPPQGRQLTAKEREANTPQALAARRVDEVTIGDFNSESAHSLKARLGRSGVLSGKRWRDAASGGMLSFVMKVDPKQSMSLYCTYWGNESDQTPRRFDILVGDRRIATQRLLFNDPGRFFDVEYRIPARVTAGQTNVTVVFQAYPRKAAGPVYSVQMLKR